MCTLVATRVATQVSTPACGYRLVNCLYTAARHATCEYSSPYQPIAAFTLPKDQPLESVIYPGQLANTQDGGAGKNS
jgi:hypothetical protein